MNVMAIVRSAKRNLRSVATRMRRCRKRCMPRTGSSLPRSDPAHTGRATKLTLPEENPGRLPPIES